MLLLSLVLHAAAVGAPEPAAVPASGSRPQNEPALERALETIDADEIRSDLTFIASDLMAGRDSPSDELRIAARYIRARLMRLGFEAGGPDDSYFYEWKIHSIGFDPERTGATLTGPAGLVTELAHAKDYFFPGYSAFGMRSASGPIVHGGSMSKRALAKIDVEARWVLDDGTSKGLSKRRLRELEERGARGVIVLPRANADETVAETLGRRNRRAGQSRLQWTPRENEPGFPVLHLSEGATEGSGLASAAAEFDAGDLLEGWSLDERCTQGDLGEVTLENVVGIWPGSDPKLSKETIILSAHYDHVGVNQKGEINNGADDNGSGTCGMLAIAEALHAYGPMRRTVMLMWVSAEEKGLLGSEAWAKDPYLPGGLEPICNVNIDMIGRNAPDEFLITPTKKHPAYSALTKVAEANARTEGFTKVKSADAYWERSDQYNFKEHMGLPVAFLFCDVHEDYHKPSDTPEKIDYDKMRRICRLVVRMLDALQIDRPKF
ncbi:MAG: M28 family peptidase [Planctomycetota bacterium]